MEAGYGRLQPGENAYNELGALDQRTQLGGDLYAYFLLKGSRQKPDQRKMVTMIADSELDTNSFTKTLNTSYHDVHLQERTEGRTRPQTSFRPKEKGGRFQRKVPGKGREVAHLAADDEYGEGEEDYEDEEPGE